MTIRLGILLSIACSLSLVCLGQTTSVTSAPVTGVVPSMALSALDTYGDPVVTTDPPKLAIAGMVIYRITVNSDGDLQHFERFVGNPDLQSVTDPVVSRWHFKQIKQKKSLISWWSLVGVCYSPEWGRAVPCLPPQAKPESYTANSVPERIYVAAVQKSRALVFQPLRPTKSGPSQIDAPQLARQAHIGGDVVLEAIVGADGRFSNVALISGHPMLAPSAIQTLRYWQFEPVKFLGNPVEALVRLTIHCGSDY